MKTLFTLAFLIALGFLVPIRPPAVAVFLPTHPPMVASVLPTHPPIA